MQNCPNFFSKHIFLFTKTNGQNYRQENIITWPLPELDHWIIIPFFSIP